MSAQRDDMPRVFDHAFAQALARREPDADPRVIDAAARAAFAIAQGHAALDLEGRRRPARCACRFALGRASRWRCRCRPRDAAGARRRSALPAPLSRIRTAARRRLASHRRGDDRRRRHHAARPALRTPVPDRHARCAPGARGRARVAASLAARHRRPRHRQDDDHRAPAVARRRAGARRPAAPCASRSPRRPAAPPIAWRRAFASPSSNCATAGLDAALCDALPTDASTLHRLLGAIPDRPRFRHGVDLPLPHDLIVVDEASMVDLPLMCKLVEAVPVGARLVLLGDRDQLPSVEAGDVLAAIADAATTVDAVTRHRAREHWPRRSPRRSASRACASRCNARIARPTPSTSRRSPPPCAMAMRTRRSRLLRGGTLRNVHFHEDAIDPLASQLRDALLAPWRALGSVDADSPTRSKTRSPSPSARACSPPCATARKARSR